MFKVWSRTCYDSYNTAVTGRLLYCKAKKELGREIARLMRCGYHIVQRHSRTHFTLASKYWEMETVQVWIRVTAD